MNLNILIILIDNQISLVGLGAFPWNLTLFNKLCVELAGWIEQLVAFRPRGISPWAASE